MNSSIFTSILSLSIGRWVTQITSLLTFLFVSNYIPVAEYGVFSLIITIPVLNELFVREAVENSIVKEKRAPGKIQVFIISLFPAVIGWLVVYFVLGTSKTDAAFIISAIVILQWLGASSRAFLLCYAKMKELMVCQIIGSLISCFVAIILAFKGAGLYALLFQQLILSVLLALVPFIYANKIHLFPNEEVELKFLLASFKKSIPSVGINAVTNRADVVLASYFLTMELVGFYAFSKRILQIVQDLSVTGFERFAMFAKSQVNYNSTNKEDFVRIVLIYLQCIASLFLLCFSEFLFPFVFDQKWLPAFDFISVMSISLVGYSLIAYERSTFYANGLVGRLFLGRTIDAGITFSLLLLGIYYFETYGVVYAFILRGFFAFVVYELILIKYDKKCTVYEAFYNRNKLVFVAIFLMCFWVWLKPITLYYYFFATVFVVITVLFYIEMRRVMHENKYK